MDGYVREARAEAYYKQIIDCITAKAGGVMHIEYSTSKTEEDSAIMTIPRNSLPIMVSLLRPQRVLLTPLSADDARGSFPATAVCCWVYRSVQSRDGTHQAIVSGFYCTH